jgi:hypothetical protein
MRYYSLWMWHMTETRCFALGRPFRILWLPKCTFIPPLRGKYSSFASSSYGSRKRLKRARRGRQFWEISLAHCRSFESRRGYSQRVLAVIAMFKLILVSFSLYLCDVRLTLSAFDLATFFNTSLSNSAWLNLFVTYY